MSETEVATPTFIIVVPESRVGGPLNFLTTNLKHTPTHQIYNIHAHIHTDSHTHMIMCPQTHKYTLMHTCTHRTTQFSTVTRCNLLSTRQFGNCKPSLNCVMLPIPQSKQLWREAASPNLPAQIWNCTCRSARAGRKSQVAGVNGWVAQT